MEPSSVINKEIKLYQDTSDKIKLGKLFTLLGVTPSVFQAELIDLVDNKHDEVNAWVLCLGRRSGKSFTASLMVVRELLVPYASVALLAPLIKTTGVLWDEVRNRLRELNIKPSSINNQARTLTLENGAKLLAASEDSIEALLGNRFSMLVVDEAAVFKNLKDILEMILYPTMSDFGVRKSGIAFGKMLIISTPRGVTNDFFTYFMMEKSKNNWRSFQHDSSVNPLNPPQFLEQMKESLDELTYRQEIMAEFVNIGGSTALHSFDPAVNVQPLSAVKKYFNKDSKFVAGLDIGFKDSSAQIIVYHNESGYFVTDATMIAQSTTKEIYEEFTRIESGYEAPIEIRYIDPSAAQTAHDFAVLYDYITYPADNSIREGISLLNQLFRTGELTIADHLHQLIEQLTHIEWKDSNSKSADPFKKHKNHHYDLVQALRYVIYTHYKHNVSSEIIIL